MYFKWLIAPSLLSEGGFHDMRSYVAKVQMTSNARQNLDLSFRAWIRFVISTALYLIDTDFS